MLEISKAGSETQTRTHTHTQEEKTVFHVSAQRNRVCILKVF